MKYRALSFPFSLYYFLFLGSQTTFEDVFPEDERLNFWFLGVKEARCKVQNKRWKTLVHEIQVVGVHKWLLNPKFCFKSLRITLNGQYMVSFRSLLMLIARSISVH